MPPPCRSSFPGPPRQALSFLVHEHTEGGYPVCGRNLPLLITTAGEKGCAVLVASLLKKCQPDFIERGPVPPNRKPQLEAPTEGTSLATIRDPPSATRMSRSP